MSIYKVVKEWKSQRAKSSWCNRVSWHHLPYITHMAILQARQSYWGHKVGHQENI